MNDLSLRPSHHKAIRKMKGKHHEFKVGDAVVVRAPFGREEGAYFREWGTIIDKTISHDGKPLFKVSTNVFKDGSGYSYANELRPETFGDYITRHKNGRWMFGANNPWPLAFAHAVAAVWFCGLIGEVPGWACAGLAIPAVIWAWTYFQFKGWVR